jgi:hypothetical protein
VIFDLALFWFVLLGSKLVLSAVVIYLLLPKERECAVCNAETLPVESPRGLRRIMKLMRIRRYWCVECDRESIGRTRQSVSGASDVALRPVAKVRLR